MSLQFAPAKRSEAWVDEFPYTHTIRLGGYE